MEDIIKSAFLAFTNKFRSLILEKENEDKQKPGRYLLQPTIGFYCYKVLETTECLALCESIRSFYQKKYTLLNEQYPAPQFRMALDTFFKRSGFYNDCWNRNEVNDGDYYDLFINELNRDYANITYYAPIEYITFAKEKLEFKDFRIEKLSENQLEKLLQSEFDLVHNSSKKIDVNKLSKYWAICTTKKIQLKTPLVVVTEEEFMEQILLFNQYSKFPAPVENAIKILALWAWEGFDSSNLFTIKECDNPTLNWKCINIPFYLHMHDHMLYVPFSYNDFDIDRLEGSYIYSGDHKEFSPSVRFQYNPQLTEVFENILNFRERTLAFLRQTSSNYNYLENALGFLAKALHSSGLEQLLWHMIALEALIGENKDGMRQFMGERIAAIRTDQDEIGKEIIKEFKRLYDIRCNLVHGRNSKKNYVNNLIVSRVYARQTTLWFISFLQ